jgi:YesN/AraC family two-component response regulator
LRIEEAKKLLASIRRIDDVATESGFMDAKYFSKVFKRFVGESPQTYRNGVKEK